jgi:FAD/FMN-containing dehydrogenase
MLPPPDIRGIYRTDARARAAYAEGAGIYRIVPRAVSLPTDTADLIKLVAWAADHRVPLVPRGAGSAMGGGNVGPGVVVDLTRMRDRRIDVDPLESRAVTGASVVYAKLNQAAARHGLRLPPDPSSGRWATLGGMVATNAAGARSVRYGSVRGWVEALTLVTADAESVSLSRANSSKGRATTALTRFEQDAASSIRKAAPLIESRFPKTRKNSSGYALDAYLASGDIVDLVIGSEGTLGIVTEIEWRLDKVPESRAALRVDLASLDDIGEVVGALRKLRPAALELLDRTFLELVDLDLRREGILLVELEHHNPDALRESVARASDAVRPLAASVETAFSLPEAERLWAIRHAASPILAGLPEDRRSLQVIEDACVPLEAMSQYIRLVRHTAGERGIPIVLFGHAGDGHVHVNLLPDVGTKGWEREVSALLDEVTQIVIELGGTPSGEHGDGRLRAGTLASVYGDEIVRLFGRVKQAFDPLGILNPGVILPSGEPPISQLKVGDTAASLPPDIARALREIELSGGYARCRMELAGEVASRESRVDS